MKFKSPFSKAKPSETKINAKMEVYAVYEDGRLLGLSPNLAAASTLQAEYPQADLLLVEINDFVWQYLQKQTEVTVHELTR